jgi:hypothetical protein
MNKHIIASVFIIAASGVVNSIVNKRAVTPVIIGSYVFLLVLAILDMFGGQISMLAGMFAMLAAITVLITEFPWAVLTQAVKGA